jgi:SAM-dependent methyltransferase
MDDVRMVETCRACGQDDLFVYFDLGTQPLANAILTKDDLDQPEFRAPLAIQRCRFCGLSQLTHVVSPDRMYRHYPFFAGVSQTWRQHCRTLAADVTARWKPKFVLDIASNDGTLLHAFKALGCKVLGVEPAQNITETIHAPSICAYWSKDLAQRLREQYGEADCLTATNVLGHVDDVQDFFAGCAEMLKPDGVLLIEVPYLVPMLKHVEFPTIYHEHLSYWTLGALQMATMGWTVIDVRGLDIHCGSMRFILQRGPRKPHRRVIELAVHEHQAGLKTGAPYDEFRTKATAAITSLNALLAEYPKVVGYPASAKGTVLLNMLTARPQYILDDTPAKQGKFLAGIHTPIVAEGFECDPLLILSWNWTDELVRRASERGFGGRWITPLPTPEMHGHA